MKTIYKKLLLLLLLLPFSMLAQSTLSGVVTEDVTGLPLPGVSVIIKGTTKGSATDFDGKFSIQNVNNGERIEFSFLGYKTQTITYNGQQTLNVSMVEDLAQLDDVVIIGYGTVRKKDATGSVRQVSSDEFNRGAIVSPDQLLSGKAAGVSVISSSGEPGAGAQIRIRGGSSLSANNDPLIVVDGVPLDQRGVQGVRNQLNSINPNEIETFDVLKDAAATAIYGSRASNGVILITTKSGKKNQEFQVEYGTQFSIERVNNYVDVFSANEFRQYVADQGRDVTNLGDANTNWQKEIYRVASGAIHDLSFSKGYERFSYRVNLNNTTRQGILRTDLYTRNAVNINLNADFFNKTLKMAITSKNSNDRNNFANRGAIGAAVHFDPTRPVFDAGSPYGGYFEFLNNSGIADRLMPRNPLALLDLEDNRASNYRTINNLNLAYDVPGISGLKLSTNLGIDYSELDGNRFINRLSADNTEMIDFGVPFRENYTGRNWNKNMDVILNYRNYLESLDTNYDFTLVHAYQQFYVASDRDFIQNGSLTSAQPIRNRNTLISYVARGQFDISDKYLISASIRRDGSSRFANKWGNFPGASVGWKIHNENFLKDSKNISELKLRGGFGVTGNNEIGVNYGYLGIYTPGFDNAAVPIGDGLVNTIRPEPYDINLKWEITKQYNVGFDLGLFNNKLNFTFDAYTKTTDDLLARIPIPSGTNLSDFLTTNVGSIQSNGLEFGLGANIIQTQNFNWNVNANFTLQEVEIKKLNLTGDPDFFIPQGGISGGVGNNIQLWSPGLDPLTFFLLRQIYSQNGNPIEGAYADINGDNSITDEDRHAYRKATPDAFFGFTSSMSYKNWDMSFTLRGSLGNYVYNNVNSSTGFTGWNFDQVGEGYRNGSKDVLNTNFQSAQYFSDYYLERADFVRLDNISIGYNIPLKDFKLRASLTGTNLFVITKYSGIDPEIPNGIDNNFYPRPIGFVAGLNFIF